MTTASTAAARRLSYQLETLWDYDYVPTHHELESLYETAKKNQWNGSTALDWARPVGKDGPVLNVRMAFAGCPAFEGKSDAEWKDTEVLVSSWRLSQFLHGEQGALMVAAQLVNSVPELDAKLYASTQVVDEGRHVNFGYFALRRSIPELPEPRRQFLEDFALRACDAMYGRDERTGFLSIKTIYAELGFRDPDAVYAEVLASSTTMKMFNRFLFTEVLIPRLQRLGLMSDRVAPRYREIGLVN